MITPEQLVKEVVDSWSLKQVMEAVDLLKTKLGVSDLVATAPAAAPASASAPAAPVEEKTEFSVFLKGLQDAKAKTKVVIAVKGAAEVSLPEAKKMVEGSVDSPCELKSALPKAEAESLKKKLEEAGGVVEIK